MLVHIVSPADKGKSVLTTACCFAACSALYRADASETDLARSKTEFIRLASSAGDSAGGGGVGVIVFDVDVQSILLPPYPSGRAVQFVVVCADAAVTMQSKELKKRHASTVFFKMGFSS